MKKPNHSPKHSDKASGLRDFSQSLPMSLLRAREVVMEQFRPHLRQLNVTEQQWRILRALKMTDITNASRLAETICISMPSLSRILVGLQTRGLIHRTTDANDHRSNRISISAAGSDLIAEGAKRSEEIYRTISESFGNDRIVHLYALLDELSHALSPSSNES